MNKRLSFKIIIIIFLLSLALFLSLVYFGLKDRKKELTDSFAEKGRATAYSLEAQISSKEDLNDKAALLDNIRKNIWLDPDIVSINFNLLEENSLIVYVSSDSNEAGEASDKDSLQAIAENMLISKIVTLDSQEALKVVSPLHVSGQTVGTVQINFTLEGINKKVNSAFNSMLFSYLIMMILFILISVLFFRIIVINPILRINKGVKAIGGGDFNYKIKITSKDELGSLAKAFNDLADTLKESRLKLEKYNESLKNEVEARTQELAEAKKKLESVNIDLEKKIKERVSQLEELKNNLEKMVEQRTAELNQKLEELEKINNFMLNRESKMIELKKEIQRLKGEEVL